MSRENQFTPDTIVVILPKLYLRIKGTSIIHRYQVTITEKGHFSLFICVLIHPCTDIYTFCFLLYTPL